MPVGLRLNFPENTVDDYDKVVKALNFPAEWPDGLIANWTVTKSTDTLS